METATTESKAKKEPNLIIDTEVDGVCISPGEVLRSPTFRAILESLDGEIKTTAEQFQQLAQGIFDGIDVQQAVDDANTLLNFYTGKHFYYRVAKRLRRDEIPPKDHAETRKQFLKDVIHALKDIVWAISQIVDSTHRRIIERADMLDATNAHVETAPKVCVAEIPGYITHLPHEYSYLAKTPVVIAAEVRTGMNYDTPANVRKEPFRELQHNPILNNADKFAGKDWIGLPFKIGKWFVLIYVHRTKGFAEMEAGLLRLFPLADLDTIETQKPDAILMLGDPDSKYDKIDADRNNCGFYTDKENKILTGVIPAEDIFGYFGYAKKPALTLHNVLAIQNGEFPLHCAANRYEVIFDEDGNPHIDDIRPKADDMGSAVLEEDKDRILRLKFRGTEKGAYACIDGLSEEMKAKITGSEVGYNGTQASNARRVTPNTTVEELGRKDDIDVILCMNNGSLVKEEESTLQMVEVDPSNESITADRVEEIWEGPFRWGKRIAAGSTGTERGKEEQSYFCNPFPELKLLKPDGNDVVLSPELYEKFRKTKAELKAVLKNLAQKGEIHIGVAESQLMAGAGNTLEELARHGYVPDILAERVLGPEHAHKAFKDLDEAQQERLIKAINEMGPNETFRWRQEVEKKLEREGPKRLAKEMIDLVLKAAKAKRERLRDPKTGKLPDKVDITSVMVGDSRTGKSETSVAMQEELDATAKMAKAA